MSQLNADSSDDEGGVSAFYIMIKSCDKTQMYLILVVIEQKS